MFIPLIESEILPGDDELPNQKQLFIYFLKEIRENRKITCLNSKRERSLGKAVVKRLDEAFKACEVIELLIELDVF